MRPIFDRAWRERALAGDAGAVTELARAMLEPLYSFCLYRLGKDVHRCEEVVQETLTRAIGELDRYDPERAGGDAFGWLTGLARNEIRRVLANDRKNSASLDALWSRMDRTLLELFAKLETEPLAESVLAREETREMVNTTMSQLPGDYREALEQKYVNGRSVREIASLRGSTEKAVESLLTRARQAFRTTFSALARNLDLELETIG